TGTIELHDQAPLVLELDLVDTVLEGTQRHAPTGAAQPPDLDRVEHAIGREGVEARRFAHPRASAASSVRSASGYTVIGTARPLRSMVRAASTRAMAPPRASAAAETRISPAAANACRCAATFTGGRMAPYFTRSSLPALPSTAQP